MARAEGAGEAAGEPVGRWLQRIVANNIQLPCLLADVGTGRIVELSRAAAKVLGSRRTELRGAPVTEVARVPWRSEAMRLLLAGGVDTFSARSTVRRADGRMLPVLLRARLVETDAERLAVLTFVPEGETLGPTLSFGIEQAPTVIGFGNGDGTIALVSEDIRDLLGHDPADVRRFAASGFVHADDVPEFLLTISTVAATGRSRHLRLRVRHADGRWIPVLAVIASLPHTEQFRVGFVIQAEGPDQDADRLEHLTELEGRLRRIAAELAVVGVSDHVDPEVARLLGELSPRQHEVVRLLHEGARVPTIAQELYLSQSTVRNHLSAIFRKFGVTSQEELLRVLRR